MDFIIKLVFVFIFFLVSNSSFAGVWDLNSRFNAHNISALKKYDVALQKKDSLGRLLAGIASVNYEAVTVSGVKVYANRPVNLPKLAVGGVFKRIAFSPWGVAISLAIASAGYFMNSDGTVTQDVAPSSALGSCGNAGNVTLSDCINYALPAFLKPASVFWSPAYSSYRIKDKNGTCCYGNWTPPAYINDNPLGGVTPVSDESIYDVVEPTLTDSTLKDVLTDVGTGLPNSNVNSFPNSINTSTPETDPITTVSDVLTNDYNNQTTTNTTTNPTVNDTSITNTSSVYNQPFNKTDCQIDPSIVGCSKFGSDLAPLEIPTKNIPFSFTSVSLSSSASCPAPITYNYSRGSFVVPTQYLCDFASGINSVVVVVSSLIGLGILVGGIRNG